MASAAGKMAGRVRARILKAPITLTDAAVDRITTMTKSRIPAAVAVRLGVKTRGCNGLAYTLDFADKPQPTDEVVTQNGATVFVDAKATMYVVGTQMDWVSDDLRSEFVFKNPNVTATCGCGESFSVA